MSDTTSSGISCIVGCKARDQHLAECADQDACWGCMPATARHGAVCTRCHRRLTVALTEQPRRGLTVTTWLLDHIPVPISRADHGHRKGSGDPPVPIRVAVVDWLNDWRIHLAGWVDVVCDHTGLVGPERAGEPEYLRDWLAVHIASIECSDYVEPLMVELAEDLEAAHGLAPWREPPPGQAKAIPCSCALREIVDRSSPPPLTIFEQENNDDLRCMRCLKKWPPDDYARWAGLVYAGGKRFIKREKEAKEAARREAEEAA